MSELGELLDDLAHERDDVDGGRVAGVADELHQDVDDRGGHLGELDGARVDRLDEELSVLEVLCEPKEQRAQARTCQIGIHPSKDSTTERERREKG